MFFTKCPICDYMVQSKTETEVRNLYLCPACGFDFTSNRCSNPDCKEPLHPDDAFCPLCGYESNFYLDCYTIESFYEPEE